MNPSIALLLCFAFVLVLLRLESRTSPDTSWAVWIPTAWMLIVASRPLIEWFVPVTAKGVTLDNDAGSIIDRWFLIALASAAILVLISRRFRRWDSLWRLKWLFVLLAYMFVSTLWSDITLIAMRRWTRELIVPIVAMVILSEVNPLRALEAVFRRTAYVLLPFSILLIKYYPLLGRVYGRYSGAQMWVGVGQQKNQLGRLCAISALFLGFALYQYWRRHRKPRDFRNRAWADAAMLLVSLYLLIGSESSTSLVSLFLGVVVFTLVCLFRRWRLTVPRSGLLTATALLIALGIVTPFIGGTDVAGLTRLLGRDRTLTGRTEIWADVLPVRAERPLLGYGLGSFWTDARRKTYDIPTAHNGYLDVLLELGDIGLVVYVVWLLSCARLLYRSLSYDYDWAALSIAFFMMSLIYSTAESALNSLTEHMTAVTVFTAVVMAQLAVPIVKRVKSGSPVAVNLEAWGANFRPQLPVVEVMESSVDWPEWADTAVSKHSVGEDDRAGDFARENSRHSTPNL